MQRKHSDWITFIICAAVGIGGAIGQSMILHNTLVHSYPFKMMNMPPASFYEWIGKLGIYTALPLAIVATLISKGLRRRFIVLIPVVLCPLVYWLFFEIAFLFSSYSGENMRGRNFDGYTGLTARYKFGFEVLGLIFWGAVVGFAIGYIFERAFQILRAGLDKTSSPEISIK